MTEALLAALDEFYTESLPYVYLGGTITPQAKHLDWRMEAADALSPDIVTISPVRGKDPEDWTQDGLNSLGPATYEDGGFVARDLRDIKRSDALLVMFQDIPTRQSLGTWVEYGYAHALGKPIVVVATHHTIAKHPFIYRLAAKVCPTLDDGIEYLKFLLAE